MNNIIKLSAGIALALSVSMPVSATHANASNSGWNYTDLEDLHIAEYGRFAVLCTEGNHYKMISLELDDQVPGNFRQYQHKERLTGKLEFKYGNQKYEVKGPIMMNFDGKIGVLVMTSHHPVDDIDRAIKQMWSSKELLVTVYQKGYIIEYLVDLKGFKATGDQHMKCLSK